MPVSDINPYDRAIKTHRANVIFDAHKPPLFGAVPGAQIESAAAYRVEDREVYVIDNFADAVTINRVAAFLRRLPFQRTEQDRPDTDRYRGFAAELPLSFLEHEPLIAAFELAVRRYFPGEEQKRYRAYVNCNCYGDVSLSHRDCQPDRPDITVLYYANDFWDRDWAGETIFFENGDGRLAVTPRPGRVALFRGAIEHRAGIPDRHCHQERLAIAYKLCPQ